ncbi:MAG: hypothetical protein IAF00_07505 [Phycisphaerales bacterium]|nr:hypothetical protein [Phycisphaerales bacterium]
MSAIMSAGFPLNPRTVAASVPLGALDTWRNAQPWPVMSKPFCHVHPGSDFPSSVTASTPASA